MKRLLFFCLALLAMTALRAQTTLEGKGPVTRREVPVSAFTTLDAGGMYELRLSSGSKESVTIETYENLQDLFEVKQEGSKLSIRMKKREGGLNFRSKTTMVVYVTVRQLDKLDLSLMGAVRTEGTITQKELKVFNKSMGEVRLSLALEHFELINEGMGRVVLEGSAADAGIRNKGMGELQAGEFRVGSLTLSNKGMGRAVVNAEKELIYKDNMMGKMENRGGARFVTKLN
ncbi:DUF2807 domain-containing protein [Flaviaesturariibacter flavus]|uniref:DUF2807 domain-containing protein n=1 Tax=Flaviaesturariibacter flavus TaxID=2502780 RepID=A0A4V2NWD8_9BACT|nr:DUF2807 domain-containing protein [Flaviaesturariibacter flavus]TCJ17022.1 DUF2807 domain-containing protein [Flaviaesturariibacter flavus]